MNEQTLCAAMVYMGSLEQPPEYCDEEAVDGSEYCEKHQWHDDYAPR